ncbi:MAG: aspartate kinase [Acutalibacteraceae bacterium]|nr:aspartate kinase [Acutalibacteraceae bacterium]
MLKVLKFGGTSMADAKQFAKVKAIVESDPSRRVVVVSAAGKRFADDHKITDLLLLCHAHIKYGVSSDSVFELISKRYIEIRDDLGLKTDIESDLNKIAEKIKTGITKDELVSRGEYLSARLMADYLGFEFVDSAHWVRFKLDGSIDTQKTYELLVQLAEGRKVVIPGFYGTMPNGTIRIMSRGGSDITGALAAAALEADVYENWTDVSGILMADPRIVKDPEPIKNITYEELRELSHMGAQVLHEGTIFPVREKCIPLNIRNTNAPEHPGSLIMEKFPDDENDKQFVTGITGKKGFAIVTVAKSGMSSEVGFLRKVLEVFEKYNVSIEYVPSGIDSVSVVVAEKSVSDCLYAILGDLQKSVKPDSINVTENIAIVAVVGRKMAYKPGMSGRLFAALGESNINIRMISQSCEELNIIAGVSNDDFEKAVQVLYNSFIKK